MFAPARMPEKWKIMGLVGNNFVKDNTDEYERILCIEITKLGSFS